MSSTPPALGIKNADELLTLAHAFGLDISIDTQSAPPLTTHQVKITIRVPLAHADTAKADEIAQQAVTMEWLQRHDRGGKGARGSLTLAQATTSTGTHKLRTQRCINDEIRELGERSATLHRDAAPLPEDVIDAPHTAESGGEQVHPGLPADSVRQFVKNRRFRGHNVHQDTTGAILIDNRRYVPIPAERQATAETYRLDVLDADGHMETTSNLDRQRAQWIATTPGSDATKDRGVITVRNVPTSRGPRTHVLTPADAPAPAPGPGDRRHARIVDGGAPQIVSTSDAVAEMNRAQLGDGRKAVREMSAAKSWARIVYRDERGTVELRPATDEDLTAAAEAAQGRRPAAELLATDQIPAGWSVYDGMPGRRFDRDGITYEVLTGRSYIVQERSGGAWIMPNHDDPAHVVRGRVVNALRRISDRTAGRARMSADTDGTVYVSDGRQAARYLPIDLFADFIPGQCPGCRTWSTSNGDGPCPGGTSAKSPEHQAAKLLGDGDHWTRHHYVFGEDPVSAAVDRATALGTITDGLRNGATVYRSEHGGVKVEADNGESSYWLEPQTEEQRKAAADQDAKARRRARGFAAKWVAEISYRRAEGLANVPTDDALAVCFAHCTNPPTADRYPLIREEITTVERLLLSGLEGTVDDGHRAYMLETFAALADGTARLVRTDRAQPGMVVVSAVRQENRTVAAVTVNTPPPGAPWARIDFEPVDRQADALTFAPDHLQVVTLDSLTRVLGLTGDHAPA
ncbi:hypothetical protein ACIQWY_29820 [Streptomyces albidoflavus]